MQEYPEGYYIASIKDHGPNWIVKDPKPLYNKMYVGAYKSLKHLDQLGGSGGFDKIERKLEDWEIVKYKLQGYL